MLKNGVHWANPTEWRQMIEDRAQRGFGCSASEFADGWNLGSYDIDGPKHSNLVEMMALIHPQQIRDSAKDLPQERRAILCAIRNACGPQFVHGDYRDKRPRGAHKTWGCCYVASEALYYMWGKARGFKPHYAIMRNGGKHWFLKNLAGVIMDPTVAQFKKKPNYKKSKACGFQQMSSRCIALMAVVKMQAAALQYFPELPEGI